MEVSRWCESAAGAAAAAGVAGAEGAACAAGAAGAPDAAGAATSAAGAAGAEWLLKGSSWPERSEGHERSPAGVYIYVFDHPEGKATVKCVCVFMCIYVYYRVNMLKSCVGGAPP